MAFLSYVRNKAFWFLDSLKGSQVKKAYNEIKHIDNLDSGSLFIKEHQRKSWETLKNRAIKLKPYEKYKDKELCEFPIINKQIIKDNQDDFLSSKFKKEELVKMYTSGSTGTPFVCYQNGYKKKRVNAEIIYYSEKVGYKLGENLSYIRTVVKQVKKSPLKQFLQNQKLIQCASLSDEGIEKILSDLRRMSKKGKITLLAYGSTYTALKNYFINHNIQMDKEMNLTGCISGSDMLFDETRKVISDIWGVELVSRYSNEENGVIGQDEMGGGCPKMKNQKVGHSKYDVVCNYDMPNIASSEVEKSILGRSGGGYKQCLPY